MDARILVVDDEATICSELCEALRDSGLEATGVESSEQALERIAEESFDLCLCDIRLPGIDGIELLRRLAELSPETEVIMMTAYGDLRTAIEALRSGAADYVLKPFLFEDILNKLRRLLEQKRLAREVRHLRRAIRRGDTHRRMIGDSPAMRQVFELVAKVAATPSNVLISGGTGTGKELVALSVHAGGDDPEAPFVPINCAAIPENLLESELFGHVKGAFSGAVASKEGLLQAAGKGTVFLDEIAEMPVSLQAKLLRVIESREVRPLGSVRRVAIKARILAASNRDLEAEVAAGRFREDLYYRLAVIEIRLPSLNERREDIPALAQHFVDKYNDQLRRRFLGISNQALQLLVGYRWKGNVRELENAIERAMIVGEGELITPQDLPAAIQAATPVVPDTCLDLHRALRRYEAMHIDRVLELCDGDKELAAQKLGLSLSSLYRKLAAAD